jgi:hypothetical protein
MNTTPEPSEEELSQAKECVIAQLAFHWADKSLLKINSVAEYTAKHDELLKNSTYELSEALKSEGGIKNRLTKVTELWDAGIHFLLSKSHKMEALDREILTVGLRTLNLNREALYGGLIMLKHPNLREKITNPKRGT